MEHKKNVENKKAVHTEKKPATHAEKVSDSQIKEEMGPQSPASPDKDAHMLEQGDNTQVPSDGSNAPMHDENESEVESKGKQAHVGCEVKLHIEGETFKGKVIREYSNDLKDVEYVDGDKVKTARNVPRGKKGFGWDK